MNDDFECGTCGKGFPAGYQARENHLRSTGHLAPTFECDSCERYFRTERARVQHMQDKNHFYWECRVCDETYQTEELRLDHEHEDHLYCHDCQRYFVDRNSLKMHLNSGTHRGYKVQCPFCKANFATATGMTHHLERGSCPHAPNLNRDAMYKFVRSKDPNGVISKNLLDWHGSPRYEATERSWNPYHEAYECYFCHRLFNSLASLTQHLNSPVHQENLYHCPNRGCRKEFTTLAAIINHLESESCGYIRFEGVQRRIQGIVNGKKLITM